MRKILKPAIFTVVLLMIIRILSLLLVPVGEIIPNENAFENLYNEYSDYDIYVLEYISSTGASWAVRESSNRNMAGEKAVLGSVFPYFRRSF